MKRKLLAGLIAAVLVTAGVVGGVVLAQEGEETHADDSDSKTVFERVSEILNVDGVDADVIEDAFNQAKHDIETDRVSDYLDQLVEKDVIDQETADSYLEWYGDRPAGLSKIPWLLPYGGWKGSFGDWHSSTWPEIEELLKGEGLTIPKIWHSGKQFRFYFPKGSTAD